jgi:hypothetical protein
MTSAKQIEANRRNALKSTGPKTEVGNERSRRNATRHGLTAETVIAPFEDGEDYTAFEMSITSAFDAQTAVERELVLRLASVMWRLRRSTAIETGLLQLGRHERLTSDTKPKTDVLSSLIQAVRNGGECSARLRETETIEGHEWQRRVFTGEWTNVELALRFAELAKFDNDAFERLTRYETALWRQAAHLLVALNFFHRPSRNLLSRRRESPFPNGNARKWI